jgi:hypothetical protein
MRGAVDTPRWQVAGLRSGVDTLQKIAQVLLPALECMGSRGRGFGW